MDSRILNRGEVRIKSLARHISPNAVSASETGATEDPLLVDIDEKRMVATLIINQPPWNPIGVGCMNALEEAVTDLALDDRVRAVVLTSAGEENFSVGMNLKQLPKAVETLGSIGGVLDQRIRVLAAIENMKKPFVATLYGNCLGGGLELPMACHFRIASSEAGQAKIGLPEMHIGTVPAWAGTARLTRIVGRAHALDMILRAKSIDGPEALRIGLVTEVCPLAFLKERAQALAEELASMPPIAVEGVLECVVGAGHRSVEEAVAVERRAVLATLGTPDQIEGMRAFAEKRKPVFTGER